MTLPVGRSTDRNLSLGVEKEAVHPVRCPDLGTHIGGIRTTKSRIWPIGSASIKSKMGEPSLVYTWRDSGLANLISSFVAGRALKRVSNGARTRDHWNHNPVLYQLSYTHRVGADSNFPRPQRQLAICSSQSLFIKRIFRPHQYRTPLNLQGGWNLGEDSVSSKPKLLLLKTTGETG